MFLTNTDPKLRFSGTRVAQLRGSYGVAVARSRSHLSLQNHLDGTETRGRSVRVGAVPHFLAIEHKRARPRRQFPIRFKNDLKIAAQEIRQVSIHISR